MPPLGEAAAALLHLLHGRWVALVTSTLVLMVAGGSAFLFPVYSKAIIKASLLGDDNKAEALSMLAVSKNLGASFGFLPSLIYSFDVAPPWVVLASVAAMNLVGVVANLVPYLAAVAGHIARHPLWLMCISTAVGANAQAFAVTGALVSSVKNFPDHRGPVLSLLLAFAGLGGDTLTMFARASGSGGSAAALLLFMPCLYLVLLPFTFNSIRVMPAGGVRKEAERRGVVRFLLVSAASCAFLLIFHVVDLVAAAHLPGPVYYYVAAIFVVLFLVISLLLVAVTQESSSSSPARAATSGGEAAAAGLSSSWSARAAPSGGEAAASWSPSSCPARAAPSAGEAAAAGSPSWSARPATSGSEAAAAGSSSWSSPARDATSGGEAAAAGSSSSCSMLSKSNPTAPPSSSFRPENDDYSILRAIFSLEMLLIAVVTFAIGGGVQTPIDMMDQIGQSLRYKDGVTSKLVSLVSLLDYAGRLVGGLGSEYMVDRYKLPRPAALTMAFLLACFGHLLIALDLPLGLYLASSIFGFTIGAMWAVVFVTISEVFGTRHLAALYNLAVMPAAVGSYILNVQVTGHLYKREAQRQDHDTCIGVQCFRVSSFILLAVTLLGAVVSAVLALWVWPSYRRAPVGAAGVAPDTTDCSNHEEEGDAAV